MPMLKRISARHFDLTPELKITAEAEMESLTKYFENIISAELILDVERHRRLAELNVKVYSSTLTGTGESDDIYNSISIAVDKVKVQLKKYKGKLKDKKPEAIMEAKNLTTRPSTDVDAVDM
jgi:putative sigma-54 modulation protein